MEIQYFIITFMVLGIVILGMAVGVIISNKALRGSCGGLSKVMGDDCMFCEEKDECKKEQNA